MKNLTSVLLAAMLAATLGCGAFAATQTSSAASSEAASSAASSEIASSAASSETASSAASSETASSAASSETASSEAAPSEAAPSEAAPSAAVSVVPAVSISAASSSAPVLTTTPVAAATPSFKRDETKALLTFKVGEKTYYSQIEYGNQIRLYPEVPMYMTDKNDNRLVFNVWVDENGVPFYPGNNVDEDVVLTAHYAFASFTPNYLFLPTNKLNQQYAPKGPFTTVLANLPSSETRTPAELTCKTGNYSLVKVIKQADGSARAYGSTVGTTYIAVKDSVTETTAYIHAVTYDPALQKDNKVPVLTVGAPEWSDTATTWSWHADPAIPKMVK